MKSKENILEQQQSLSLISLISSVSSKNSLKSKSNTLNKTKLTLKTSLNDNSDSISDNKSKNSKNSKNNNNNKNKNKKNENEEIIKKKLIDKSDNFLKNEEIYRKFRVSVKQTDDYINKINTLSNNRIQERCASIILESKIDKEIDESKEVLSKIQHEYLIEVDKSLEDRSQLRAQRQYHIAHIELLLPQWCKVLLEVRDIIKSYGHLNKLQWRSKAKSILQRALELMLLENNNSAIEECIVTVRHLIVSINVYTAQHIIMMLQEVKMNYINNLDDGIKNNDNNENSNENNTENENENSVDSLGYHCRKVREIDEILIKKPVPLLREEWSDNLLQTIQTKNILESNSLHYQFSTNQFPPPESTSISISSPNFNSNSFSPLKSTSQNISKSPNKLLANSQSLNQSFSSIFSNSNNSTNANIDNIDMKDLQIGYSSEYQTDSFNYGNQNILQKTNSYSTNNFSNNYEMNNGSTSKSVFSLNSNSILSNETEESITEQTITTLPIRYPPSSKIINHTTAIQYLRQLSKDGLFEEAWGVFNSLYAEYIVYNDPTNQIYKSNLKSPPTLETIKLLFISLKNAPFKYFSNNDITNLLQLLKRLKIVPDVILYNIILCTCEKYGAWRRALYYIKNMQEVYNILPNTHTYEILINCCRHSIHDTPVHIFETLRNEGLPRKYCYQAATCNAGNYVSQEVTKHMFRDTYDPFTSHVEHSQTLPTKSSSLSLKNNSKTDKTNKTNNTTNFDDLIDQNFSNSITKQKYFSINTGSYKNKNDTTLENNENTTESKLNLMKSEKKWNEFENNIRSTLQWRSPAKHPTGPSAHNFTRQVAKLMMPIEDKLHETTQILDSFPSSNSMFLAMTSLNSTSTTSTMNDVQNKTKLKPLNRSLSSISHTKTKNTNDSMNEKSIDSDNYNEKNNNNNDNNNDDDIRTKKSQLTKTKSCKSR